MKLTRAAALVAAPVAVGALLLAPAAYAQPLTGPASPACLNAQVLVGKNAAAVAVAQVAAANADGAAVFITTDQQTAIDAQSKLVVDAKAKLDVALKALESDKSDAAAAAAAKAGAAYIQAVGVLLSLPVTVDAKGAKSTYGDLNSAGTVLAQARAELDAAVGKQTKACAPVVPPAPPTAPTAAPTTTPAPATTTAAPTPTVNPVPTTTAPAVSVVTVAPVGGVETGYGPA